MTTSNNKPRAATETADALNDTIIRKARTLTDANRKYEFATSVPEQVTSLGWQIIAIDLRTYGSSDLTVWRAEQCEKHAAALRERTAACVPPLPAGTLCRFGTLTVRAYANIRVGEEWDGTYEVYLTGERQSSASRSTATREQLQPIGGGS